VHDVGKTESGDPFLVMDYLPGGSLKKVLQDRGPLPWREAVELVADLAHTLTEVHAQDMYHRDIKPDNILFDNRGLPHLSDFGLASRFETLSIDMAGHSPGYASPEQLFKVVHLDGRSDLFSLGVVLYEALTGRRPVPFRTREEYKAKLADPFLVIPPIRQKIPDIPQDLDNLCLQLLQLNPVQRPTTAADVEQQLRRLMAPPSPPTPPAIPSRVWLYGGVVIACLGLPISVFSVLRPTPGVSHIPGAWGDVSGGIEQVIWPGHDGETTFSVDPQGKTLSLLTTTTCVVSLGQPKGRNFTLKVCVNPPSPGAMSGVCWNSRRETHDGITLLVFDAVLIESIQGNWTARLAVMNINPETGDLTVRQLRSDRVVIQLPSEKAVELTLRFTEEALLQVESPEFASPTRSLKGWHSFEKVENLGLFSSRSPAIFSRFQVLKTVD
jgi:serine/threonine protein kinase